MVKINRIYDDVCELYSPEGRLIGRLYNQLEFNDARIQISEQNLSGYYIIFNEERYDIEPTGVFLKWPGTLYQKVFDQASYLIKLRMGRIGKLDAPIMPDISV